VAVIHSNVDVTAETYCANRAGLLDLLDRHEEQLALARAGGGERYSARHHARGRLLARERIELLLDVGSPFLELSPLTAWGSSFNVGGSIVTGVGVTRSRRTCGLSRSPWSTACR
jgi:acetyl-CoA carboxylase carboxyltransferase component